MNLPGCVVFVCSLTLCEVNSARYAGEVNSADLYSAIVEIAIIYKYIHGVQKEHLYYVWFYY